MKYKVGDKVRVKNDLFVNEQYGNGVWFRNDMARYEGQVVTISKVEDDFYNIEEDKCRWCWIDEMFEDVEEGCSDMTVKDLLDKTFVTAKGFVIALYGHGFKVTVGHNCINKKSEFYKRFVEAYGDMKIEEIFIEHKEDNDILDIKVIEQDAEA